MKNLLIFTSLIELTLGISLIIIPAIVLKLLFGIDDSNIIVVLGRFTGIVFFCFGLACFPAKNFSGYTNQSPAVRAMFIYNLLAAVYLTYLKAVAGYDGILLLPACILHTLITIYFIIIMSKKISR